MYLNSSICFFFFNDTATTEIYTLSLHDALPIYLLAGSRSAHLLHYGDSSAGCHRLGGIIKDRVHQHSLICNSRSEEHTSELQSQSNLVCRLLPAKKNIAGRTRRYPRC